MKDIKYIPIVGDIVYFDSYRGGIVRAKVLSIKGEQLILRSLKWWKQKTYLVDANKVWFVRGKRNISFAQFTESESEYKPLVGDIVYYRCLYEEMRKAKVLSIQGDKIIIKPTGWKWTKEPKIISISAVWFVRGKTKYFDFDTICNGGLEMEV